MEVRSSLLSGGVSDAWLRAHSAGSQAGVLASLRPWLLTHWLFRDKSLHVSLPAFPQLDGFFDHCEKVERDSGWQPSVLAQVLCSRTQLLSHSLDFVSDSVF